MEATKVTYNGVAYKKYDCTRCSGTMMLDLETIENRCLKCVLCGQEVELENSEVRGDEYKVN